jgi:hypothetical protein
MICPEESCSAEIAQQKRVATVDDEYGGRPAARYAGVCDEGHLVTWDAGEESGRTVPADAAPAPAPVEFEAKEV